MIRRYRDPITAKITLGSIRKSHTLSHFVGDFCRVRKILALTPAGSPTKQDCSGKNKRTADGKRAGKSRNRADR